MATLLSAAAAVPVSKQAKSAAFGLPDGGQLWDRVKRYGPGFAAAGAGTAGLVNLLGEYRRSRQDAKAREDALAGRTDNDTLVVRVPEKTAGKVAMSLSPRVIKGIGLGAGALTAAGATNAALHEPTPAEAAVHDARPNPGWENLMDWGVGGAAALGGYGLVDNLMRRRRQNDLQAELEHEKKDYADLLGHTLGDPEAKSAAVRFPCLEGFIAGLTDELTAPPVESPDKTAGFMDRLLSTPTLLAGIGAVVAHKFVHDQEVAADQAHAVKKFSPPKAIRIQTVPRPVEALPMPSAAALSDEPVLDPTGSARGPKEKDEDKLAAGFEELAELGGVAMLAGAGKKEKKELGEEAVIPARPEPVLHDLSANEARVDTPAGQTTLEAADPGAVRVLQNRKVRLARLLAVGAAA